MIINNIKQKIKEYFFLNPTIRLRVRHIEKTVKVHLPSAIRYARELEKERILKILDISGVKFYSANRASRNFLVEKKLFNIHQLYLSGFIDFLAEELNNPTIIVFGSYSIGEDIESSDIDIYIETQSKKKVNLEKFEKKLQRRIQLFIYKNINDVENKELRNNIINGIVLNGFIYI